MIKGKRDPRIVDHDKSKHHVLLVSLFVIASKSVESGLIHFDSRKLLGSVENSSRTELDQPKTSHGYLRLSHAGACTVISSTLSPLELVHDTMALIVSEMKEIFSLRRTEESVMKVWQ